MDGKIVLYCKGAGLSLCSPAYMYIHVHVLCIWLTSVNVGVIIQYSESIHMGIHVLVFAINFQSPT